MNKKLIFFLYIGDDRTPQERISAGFVAKVHFYCLKKYRQVFDEAKFVLSVRDNLIGNTMLIGEYVSFIMSLGYFDNTEFVVERNTQLRESKTFKEEIVDSKDNDGKLVFFAHLRGESNDNEQVQKWVFSNYFYGLSNVWEVEYWLAANMKVFFGFPLVDFRGVKAQNFEIYPKNGFYYPGSIFWTNISLLREVLSNRGFSVPPMIGRFYSENFPADAVYYEMVSTTNYVSCPSGHDYYSTFTDLLNTWCESSGRSVEEFNDEFEKIKTAAV